jgi:Iron-containing redox enzyme
MPRPRGELTEYLCSRLRGPVGVIPALPMPLEQPSVGEDSHLALHLCFGLHYDGFDGVDDGWEWEPSLLALRAKLVEAFLAQLIADAPESCKPGQLMAPDVVATKVLAILNQSSGPSLSEFMADEGSYENLGEFIVHRSIYQRKEADPHTWAIPRLRERAKSALVTLQADEYGNGRAGRTHAELFASTMAAFDLDPAPGAYIDQVPGVTLATDNLVSIFGLHRRWRGALVGHLAAFEMTSVVPMGRYAKAVRRLGIGETAAEFYDVHVIADEIHQGIAADELLVGLAESDPEAAMDTPFGVSALLAVESRFTSHLFASWNAGRSSLLTPPRHSSDALVAAGAY